MRLLLVVSGYGYMPFPSTGPSEYGSSTTNRWEDHIYMIDVNVMLKAMELIYNENSSPVLTGFGSNLAVEVY